MHQAYTCHRLLPQLIQLALSPASLADSHQSGLRICAASQRSWAAQTGSHRRIATPGKARMVTIDLTDSPSHCEAPTSKKRTLLAATSCKSSVHSQSEPAAAESNEEAARKRIMAQAASVNASSGKNSLLAQLHAETRARRGAQAFKVPQPTPKPFSLLTWNIWFAEDVQGLQRMAAIGNTIAQLGFPDFICFQEMTPNLYQVLQHLAFWQQYTATPAQQDSYFTTLLYKTATASSPSSFRTQRFEKTIMGRDLTSVSVTVGGHRLRIANSHLESPIPGNKSSSFRKQQCSEALQQLDQGPERNVLFAGDMNWNWQDDGQDAWAVLRPGDDGFTYDGVSNAMLINRLRTRVDRIFAKLQDWRLQSIQMVGRAAIPNLTYQKVTSTRKLTLQVLPSDHYGLHLVLEPQAAPAQPATQDAGC